MTIIVINKLKINNKNKTPIEGVADIIAGIAVV